MLPSFKRQYLSQPMVSFTLMIFAYIVYIELTILNHFWDDPRSFWNIGLGCLLGVLSFIGYVYILVVAAHLIWSSAQILFERFGEGTLVKERFILRLLALTRWPQTLFYLWAISESILRKEVDSFFVMTIALVPLSLAIVAKMMLLQLKNATANEV